MAVSKVVYAHQTLIDLTEDTVTEKALLKGYTAHKSDGSIIIGTLFSDYPNDYCIMENIVDSNESIEIQDSSGQTIQGSIVYKRA